MKIRKQGISWLLCLVMLLSLTNLSAIPASAAATSMPAGETRNGITYIKLTEDVSLNSRWVVEKNIDLDLNGHDIYRSLSKGSKVGEVINVNNKNVTLSIRDTSSDDVSKQGRIRGGRGHAGGGILVNEGTVNLYSGRITDNSADTYNNISGNGGAIYLKDEDDSKFYMYGGEISNNTATGCGGAIYAIGAATISGGEIVNNSCNMKGGAVYANYGGYITSYTPLTVTGGVFRGNKAASGGAIFIQDGKVPIENATFAANEATGNGGAIYCNDNDGTIIQTSTFTGNTANNGSAVYLNTKDVRLFNLTIEANTARNSTGGALYSNDYAFTLGGKMIVRGNTGKNMVFKGSKEGKLNAALTKGADVYLYSVVCVDEKRDSYGVINYSDSTFGNLSLPYCHSDQTGYIVTADSTKIRLIKSEDADTDTSSTPSTYTVNGTTYALQKGTFKTPSHNDLSTDLAEVYFYSDGYFMQDAKIYNEHLSTMSLSLAMAAFNSNLGTWSNQTKAQNIIDLYDDLNFQDIEINEGYKVKPTRNTIGIALAHRTLPDGSVLLPIALRGTNYDAEWASNVTIGTSGESTGFLDAANQTMEMVEGYLKDHNLNGNNVKFWVVGYSRTGAVSNMVAKKLIDAYNNDGTRVYAYCHAPANGGVKSELKSGCVYTGIHNIINASDVVPYVPLAEMGFIRYGTDHYVPGSAAGTISEKNDSKDPSLYKDNSMWRTTSDAYKVQKAKMLRQLSVVESDIVFDDNFSRATIDYFPPWTQGVNKRSTAIYSAWEPEDYVKNLMTFLKDEVLPGDTRTRYSSNTKFFKDQYEFTYTNDSGKEVTMTIEEAAAYFMELWRADLDSEDFSNLISKAANITSYLSDTEIKWLYFDVISDYGKLSAASQYNYASQMYSIVKTNVLEPALRETGKSDAEVERLLKKTEALWYPVADTAFTFLWKDYINHNQDYAGTLVYNLSRIANAHTPVVNYAWVRSYDSFYNSIPSADGTVTAAPSAPEITVLEGKTADSDGNYTEDIQLQLTSKTTSADIYYTINGEEELKYSEPVKLTGKKGETVNYSITAYAKKPLDGACSEAVVGSYIITIPADSYTVSVNGGTAAEYPEGSTVTVSSDTADTDLFKGWKTYRADNNTEIGEEDLPGFDPEQKVISFTMPSYDINLQTETVKRIGSVNITMAEPSAASLPTETTSWSYRRGTDDTDVPVTGEKGTLPVMFSVSSAGNTDLTANITIPADEAAEIAFTPDVTVTINDQEASVVRNSDGSVTVTKTYSVTPEKELHTVRINLKNINGKGMYIAEGQSAPDYIDYQFAEGSDVKLTAPVPLNHVFTKWNNALNLPDGTNQAESTLEFTMPSDTVTVDAIYTPTVHTVSIRIDEPKAGEKLADTVNSCRITVTDEQEVPTSVIDVSYENSDSPIAGYDKEYTAVLSVSAAVASTPGSIFTLAGDTKVTVNDKAYDYVIDRSDANAPVVKVYVPMPKTASDNRLASISAPGTITVPHATSDEDLMAGIRSELPQTLTGFMQDGTIEQEVPIAWSKNGLGRIERGYDPANNEAQTFQLDGTIKYTGNTTSDFYDETTITIFVENYQTVYQSHGEISPTGSVPYGGDPISVLPQTVEVTAEDGYTADAEIIWAPVEGTPDTAGGDITVTGTLVLPQYFQLPEGQTTAPAATATVHMEAKAFYQYEGYLTPEILIPYMDDTQLTSENGVEKFPKSIILTTNDPDYTPSINVIWDASTISEKTLTTRQNEDGDGSEKYWTFTVSGTVEMIDIGKDDEDTATASEPAIPDDITGFDPTATFTANVFMEVNEDEDDDPTKPDNPVNPTDPTDPSSGDKAHVITVGETENGTITLDKESAVKGDTVTITPIANDGYTLDTITVIDNSGREVQLTEKDGKYTFTMPDGQVTVKTTYREDNTTRFRFVDVSESDYFHDAVYWAVDKGVTVGTDDTHFSPDGSCTRAEAVTFLWRANGSPDAAAAGEFVDVSADAYYAKAVSWAVAKGITVGTSATTFDPDLTCTRAQIAAFMYRSAGSPDITITDEFSDVSADAYYAKAVSWARANGITEGTSATTFDPDADCTRAQIVTFIYRQMK